MTELHITEITLPWPDTALSSNSRQHWAVKAKKTRGARELTYFLCKEAKLPTIEDAVIEFTYHPKDKRRRDCQNMPHCLKAYIDGIADYMGCDDHNFRVRYPDQFGEIREGGEIVVKIYPPVTQVPVICSIE